MPSFVRKAACGLFVTSILATAATSAFADPPSNTYVEQNGPGGQGIIFTDPDQLGAGAYDPNGFIIKIRPSAVRMVLVRPRTQFVSEMLKSVENL